MLKIDPSAPCAAGRWCASGYQLQRRMDDWRRTQPYIPARAEAIRRLVEFALKAAAEPPS